MDFGGIIGKRRLGRPSAGRFPFTASARFFGGSVAAGLLSAASSPFASLNACFSASVASAGTVALTSGTLGAGATVKAMS